MSDFLSAVDHYQHQYYMSRAITLPDKRPYTTRPNTKACCVIVSEQQIIGEGYHYQAGQPHAEVFALKQAAAQHPDKLVGATAYVTLEPCSHYGRTPPCADALIQAGIAEVVIAVTDPNPKVAGGGIAKLQQAGIHVITGISQERAYALNRGFFQVMSGGLPFVRLKIASSLDGGIAMASGQSKWITSETARADVQRLRAQAGAIITGSETVLQDQPSLNVRQIDDGIPLSDIPQPLLVVLDRRHRIKTTDIWYQNQQQQRPIILMQEANLSLTALLEQLKTDYHIHDILIEAGAQVAGSFLQAGLVDELIVYQAPCILGHTARSMIHFPATRIEQQLTTTLVSHETVGNDLKLTYRFDK